MKLFIISFLIGVGSFNAFGANLTVIHEEQFDVILDLNHVYCGHEEIPNYSTVTLDNSPSSTTIVLKFEKNAFLTPLEIPRNDHIASDVISIDLLEEGKDCNDVMPDFWHSSDGSGLITAQGTRIVMYGVENFPFDLDLCEQGYISQMTFELPGGYQAVEMKKMQVQLNERVGRCDSVMPLRSDGFVRGVVENPTNDFPLPSAGFLCEDFSRVPAAAHIPSYRISFTPSYSDLAWPRKLISDIIFSGLSECEEKIDELIAKSKADGHVGEQEFKSFRIIHTARPFPSLGLGSESIEQILIVDVYDDVFFSAKSFFDVKGL